MDLVLLKAFLREPSVPNVIDLHTLRVSTLRALEKFLRFNAEVSDLVIEEKEGNADGNSDDSSQDQPSGERNEGQGE